MPKHVLVAGAGIVGVSTAIWLQRAGYKVTLVDREGPAAGTSHGNAGVLASGALVPVTVPGLWKKAPRMALDRNQPLFLRWSYLPKLAPFLFKYMRHATASHVEHYASAMSTLMGDSVEQHKALSAGTPAEQYITDLDYCFGYQTEKQFNADAYGWDVKKRHGGVFDVVPGDKFSEYDPVFDGKFHTVVRSKNHGSVRDPGAYIKALAEHFVEHGGTLHIANIRGLKRSEDGKSVEGIETDEGLIGGDEVVIAMGSWSKTATKDTDHKFDLEAERGYHIEFYEPSVMPRAPMMVAAYKFVLSPMVGRLRCAGVVEFGGLKAGKSDAPLDLIKRQLKDLLPDLTYERQVEWLGHRPATPNSLPSIGRSPGVSNAHIGVGHQHLGLTGGAKTGRMLAEMIDGKRSNIDLSPFEPK